MSRYRFSSTLFTLLQTSVFYESAVLFVFLSLSLFQDFEFKNSLKKYIHTFTSVLVIYSYTRRLNYYRFSFLTKILRKSIDSNEVKPKKKMRFPSIIPLTYTSILFVLFCLLEDAYTANILGLFGFGSRSHHIWWVYLVIKNICGGFMS